MADTPTPGQPGTIQPQPEPPQAPNFTPGPGAIFAVVGTAAVVVALYFINARVLRRPPEEHKPPEQKPPEQQQLPPPPERIPEIPIVPRAEREKLEVELRQAFEKVEAQRLAVEGLAARAATDAGLKAQLESEQNRLKDLEEERKKAEYRLRKISEAEDKDRKKAEADARARIEAAEKERMAAEEKARQAAEAEAQRQKVEAHAGRTLADGLAKTRSGFMGRLSQLFGASKSVDDKTLAELEEILFTADIGVQTAQRLLDLAREKVKARELSDGDKLKAALRGEVERILSLDGAPPASASKPRVLMVVGVNGSGKTTTIGKLAAQFAGQGKSVVLGAGDTYRAAAGEQLEVWAKRANVPIVQGQEGSDPGAVLFDAIKKGQATNADIVICDTAGRLHTNEQLMEELKKVKRVIGKAQAGAPDEVLLVIDSTNGQTAIAQAKKFHEALGVNSIALTKLDGTAKGGVIIGICDELKIPVRYVGVGEALEDLQGFQPHAFVEALFQ